MSGILKQAVLIVIGKARIAGGDQFRFMAAFMGAVHLALGLGSCWAARFWQASALQPRPQSFLCCMR